MQRNIPLAVCVGGGILDAEKTAKGEENMKVLFVGNSHTYFNDMPRLFARMCAALTGEEPRVQMLAYSNRGLAWHREEYYALRFALLYGGFDYCVLQQQAHPMPPEAETRAALRQIMALCRQCGTEPVLFMTWAMKAEPEVAPVMCGFYRQLAAETGALLCPVGERFAALTAEHPEIELYWKDGAHASPAGDYLIAALFAALLTGRGNAEGVGDEALDFRTDFEGENGLPLSEEDAGRVAFRLDPVTAATLREYARL